MKNLSIVYLSIIFCVSNLFAQSICFKSNTIKFEGLVDDVTNADFNGDGKVDLATVNFESNNVSVLLGNDLGGFGTATDFKIGKNPISLISGDFNRDGKLDLATANSESNNVSVLLGNGLGSFGTATNFNVGTNPMSLISGDFNGDSKLDLATANFGSHNVSILFGNGLGSFGAATNFNVGTYPESLICGDFNRDSKLDLAIANSKSNNVSILLGNGLGSFGTVTNFNVGTYPRSLISGDFNGDSKLDLAIANYGSNTVSVLLGNGLGSFGTVTNFNVGSNPKSLISGDFNADGKIDLAITYPNYVSIIIGSGLGSFGSEYSIFYGGSSNKLISVDFNNDSVKDIISVNRECIYTKCITNINILNGDGVGGFSPINSLKIGAGKNNSNSFHINGDFNGDGKLDLATANIGSKNVSVLFGNGLGSFGTATNFNVGIIPKSLISGDFDSDGKLDLATANNGSNNVSVLLGNGLDSFGTATNFNVGTYPESLISGDFNGDGKLDLATANNGSNNVSILFGNGLGSFGTATNFNVGTNPISLISGDFNGDSKLDLATANFESNNVSVLLGNGLGSFGTATNFNVGTYPMSLISGDFNGDSKLDLAMSHSLSTNVSVLLGNGLGSFGAATNFNLGLPSSLRRLISGDFNSDGKLDLISGSQNRVSILLGNGLGSFGIETGFTVPMMLDNISYSDLNQDGKMDLLLFGNDDFQFLYGTNILLDFTTTYSDVSCYQGKDGKASVTLLSGNTAPYLYAWGSGSWSTNSIKLANLGAGSYSVSVSDISGCMLTKTVTIKEPSAISVSTINTNLTCFEGNNGKIQAFASGGKAPYSYAWNTLPIQNTSTAKNLKAGKYIVTVTDSNGCKSNGDADYLSQPSEISVSGVLKNATCFGGNNGRIDLKISGGVKPYLYNWISLPIQNTSVASDLKSGDYTVSITDSNGCIKKQNFTIQQPPELEAIFLSTPNTRCSGSCNGTASVTSIKNGVAPYTYEWDTFANNQVTEKASNLCSGKYSVFIKDANQCSVTKEVEVNLVSSIDPNIYLTNIAAVDQVNISPSFAAHYNYNLPEVIISNPSNPRNLVDPGKKARFKVECTNQKGNGQSIVSGICKVRSNNPHITITDSSSALNNIGWNDKVWSADEFEINIDPKTPSGTNAYIDFIVQENGLEYSTKCISIPIQPLVYSPTTPSTIDDDNNPDSRGNDNDICEDNEVIEFYPWLNNISTLNAEYVRGRFENLDNHKFINIWNGVKGVNTTVYDAGWWNYSFGKPLTINSNSLFIKPEYDFVFDFNNSNSVDDFNLYMVMSGGFKLFAGNALSMVQWSLPYKFNSTSVSAIDQKLDTDNSLKIFPNPTTGIVNIQFMNNNTPEKYTLKVTDVVGKELLNTKLHDIETTIDLRKVSVEGVYLFHIYDSKGDLIHCNRIVYND